MSLSYLVSTAGHAQGQNDQHPHGIKTIVQLIQEGAEEFGDEKVVGFTSLDAGQWTCQRYSYKDILALSDSMAGALVRQGVKINRDQTKIISILFPTGLDFLVIWVSLMRMGYGVVLVAPQCSPAAVLNLHKINHSEYTIYHPKYSRLAEETLQLDRGIRVIEMQLDISGDQSAPPLDDLPIDPQSISHVFHSSGTSGLPKPIPNTHAGAVSVLPRRKLPSYLASNNDQASSSTMPPSESAAFTTTPLFHGGVSDLLRAWMARSMLYLYPTSDVPITTKNVVDAVNACRAPPDPLVGHNLNGASLAEREYRFKPTAFLSVPYILSTLVEDLEGEGLAMLKGMDIVSTGGAPLDTSTGDEMVKRGVNLVSRLGSSECGFLLSSHRDYESDKEWEVLRNDSPYAGALRFEETSDTGPSGRQRFEMVVTAEWASLTKSNREDGSYATGDLYEEDSIRTNEWRYVGRGDDVIVMSNGEKASPGGIETLLKSSPEVDDALVVGSDRAQLGLLIFPRSTSDPKSLLEQLEPLIKEANKSSPSYARIPMDMCSVVSLERVSALPKSSKGTVQRGVAYEVYKNEIQQLYEGPATGKELPKRDVVEIQSCIRDAVEAVAGQQSRDASLESTTDLFGWGVDSVMAARIRAMMQKTLNTGGRPLPQNIVFEEPSMKRLADYVYNLQEGVENHGRSTKDANALMETLASRYGTFDAINQVPGGEGAEDILLTGGTGSLGAHLIHQLCSNSEVSGKIVCLVRAKDDASAHIRIKETLASKDLQVDEDRLVVLSANVTQENLGLSAEVYGNLVKTIGTVIHAAWPVHFASSLVSFEDQIRGARNLINLVRQSPRSRFHFCSSIASVTCTETRIMEVPSNDPSTAAPIGYSQSKWVVEKICEPANAIPNMSDRIRILRIGQLCGDTVTGYWNEKEGWPLLIRTGQTTGVLPDLTESPSWLPVDLAAQTIVDIVHQNNKDLVYHVVHPLRIKWNTVLAGLAAAGMKYEMTTPLKWLVKVEESVAQREDDPSSGMLPMWKKAYGSDVQSAPEPEVDATNAQRASSTLAEIAPLEVGDVVNMVTSWRRTGFLEE